ncbi:MAG: hypothetical protein HRT38_06035 [Alteromonadaceae bacterium]|nr:hypothetical protein [Alteromonadaceae bacterium]
MSERDIIHDYLKSLAKYLSRLEASEADEVILEIESHIYDVLELREKNNQVIDAKSILEGFGHPRDLASQYVDHVLKGTPPPTGFKAIQHVKKGVSKSLYFAMGIFGYGISVALLILGISKLIIPDLVGVWSAANGNSFAIGFLDQPYPANHELLGFWLVPLAIILGMGTAQLTKRVLSVLKEKI